VQSRSFRSCGRLITVRRRTWYIIYQLSYYVSQRPPSAPGGLPWHRAAPPGRPLGPARGSVSCARACRGLLFELDGQAMIAVAANADEVLSTGHGCAKRTSPTWQTCHGVIQDSTNILTAASRSNHPRGPVNRLIDQAIAARDRSAPGRYVRRILYYVDTSITAAVRCCDGFTTLRSWCLTGQVKSVVLPLGPCAEPCLWA
jgi:hypothetical protein